MSVKRRTFSKQNKHKVLNVKFTMELSEESKKGLLPNEEMITKSYRFSQIPEQVYSRLPLKLFS